MNAKMISLAIALTLASAASQAADLSDGMALAYDLPSATTPKSAEAASVQVRTPAARPQANNLADGIALAYDLPSDTPRLATGLSRAQVLEELKNAQARGELEIGVLAYGVPATAHGSAPRALVNAAAGAQHN